MLIGTSQSNLSSWLPNAKCLWLGPHPRSLQCTSQPPSWCWILKSASTLGTRNRKENGKGRRGKGRGNTRQQSNKVSSLNITTYMYILGGPKIDTLFYYVNIMPYKLQNARYLYRLNNYSRNKCVHLLENFFGIPVFLHMQIVNQSVCH